jgi:DNA-directed RNA polymerase subunit RPC12/RpoP
LKKKPSSSMSLKCPKCGEELIMDVTGFVPLIGRVWTWYLCPRCDRYYGVKELKKAYRLAHEQSWGLR